MFRSLANYNFAIWSVGGLVSGLGSWMQRIAQDWLVLTELTDRDAKALGVVVAMQFAPQLVLLPWTGWAADHLDRRKLLAATQAVMGMGALALGVLTVTGLVQVGHVYLLALLLGCASAFDGPARQTFVGDMVGEKDLSNAVALNSTSTNVSQLIGPAMAGLLIGVVGTAWAFMINAATFVAVIGSLALMRTHALHPRERAGRRRGSFMAGLVYVRGRADLRALFVMLLLFGALGFHYPIFISTMAVSVFHLQASGFGFLTSALAIGSLVGALLAARRERPTWRYIVVGAAVFGLAYAFAASSPNAFWFATALVFVGAATQTVGTSTTSLVQLSTEPTMRGRVMALLFAIALGGQPLGAPFVGWVASELGPRWAVGVGAAAGLAAAGIGAVFLRRFRGD
jgi:MFS family permease